MHLPRGGGGLICGGAEEVHQLASEALFSCFIIFLRRHAACVWHTLINNPFINQRGAESRHTSNNVFSYCISAPKDQLRFTRAEDSCGQRPVFHKFCPGAQLALHFLRQFCSLKPPCSPPLLPHRPTHPRREDHRESPRRRPEISNRGRGPRKASLHYY